MKKKNFWNWFCTIALGFFAVLFIWSFALSVPIYSRYIYYSQISEIVAISGYSKSTVKTAYDQVLDYLVWHNDFATGELSCSESAKAHFSDCQKLFDLNLCLLVISAVGLATIGLLAHKKIIKLKRIGKFGILFYSAIAAAIVPLVFGVIAAIDFDSAFVLFHKILFPGKTNWYFDPVVDQIINILPESYFAICGLVIASIIVAFVTGIIIYETIKFKRKKEKSKFFDK